MVGDTSGAYKPASQQQTRERLDDVDVECPSGGRRCSGRYQLRSAAEIYWLLVVVRETADSSRRGGGWRADDAALFGHDERCMDAWMGRP
uniref:Uncharacterized protein n=1 Tax=Plectus sambesii TaxID=2011161 RepID=A0A914W2Q4_9BILA